MCLQMLCHCPHKICRIAARPIHYTCVDLHHDKPFSDLTSSWLKADANVAKPTSRIWLIVIKSSFVSGLKLWKWKSQTGEVLGSRMSTGHSIGSADHNQTCNGSLHLLLLVVCVGPAVRERDLVQRISQRLHQLFIVGLHLHEFLLCVVPSTVESTCAHRHFKSYSIQTFYKHKRRVYCICSVIFFKTTQFPLLSYLWLSYHAHYFVTLSYGFANIVMNIIF